MSEYTVERLEIAPYFDMERIIAMTQETRIGGATLERLMRLWEAWLPELTVERIDTGKIAYLVVWLSKTVEDAVDKAWEDSPSDAYLDNALAQTLCMEAVHTVLPEVEDAGCAPAPRPTDKLRAALEAEGLPYLHDGPTLSRRYAVVTHHPFKGGCEICHLQKECPKGQGQSGSASVVLPGYEKPTSLP